MKLAFLQSKFICHILQKVPGNSALGCLSVISVTKAIQRQSVTLSPVEISSTWRSVFRHFRFQANIIFKCFWQYVSLRIVLLRISQAVIMMAMRVFTTNEVPLIKCQFMENELLTKIQQCPTHSNMTGFSRIQEIFHQNHV